MTSELKGLERPRPIRVAFLVEDGEHSDVNLDAIFADCYDRWGGRFSLIVPCENGRISLGYWRWLEAFDPDIVYSYIKLSATDILEVHERLYVGAYLEHSRYPEDRFDLHTFKPKYDFQPLLSLSVIFRVARFSSGGNVSGPTGILDSWFTERPSRFLTDSFGTYHTSRGGSMFPSDARAAASLLTVVAPETQSDRHRGVPRDLNAIPNELAAFTAFTERRAISLSLASIMYAPKLDVRWQEWSGTFNLVVGDSFADRLVFWNARLLIPAWLDNDLCCLRVSEEQLADAEFVRVLSDFIKRRNHVNSGSGGQSQLVVRSCSLTQERLANAKNVIDASGTWSGTRFEIVASPNVVIPDDAALKAARESNRSGGSMFSRPDWTAFNWSGDIARPPAITPDHMIDAPPRQLFTLGHWATDYQLGHAGPGPRFSENSSWVLPKRWRMAGAFGVSYIDERRNELPPRARRSRNGALTLFQNVDHQVESIKIPTIEEALRFALTNDGGGVRPDAKRSQTYPSNRVVWTRPSNEARYLTGVLGMIGGLNRASAFLLHPFLQDTFAQFGGAPKVSEAKVEPILNSLSKEAQKWPSFDLRNEREKVALGRMIVRAAQGIKNLDAVMPYTELEARWKAYRETYWAANPMQHEPDPLVDWDRYEELTLDSCLTEMRQRQMLFQGYQWTCPQCHHKNWVDISSFKPTLVCEVCSYATPAPVKTDWLFRSNEFLIRSLRDHSVLSLIWTLSMLRDQARHTFLYTGPTWFGTSNDENPNAEVDLLVISDGQAILCEVKNSWRDIRPSMILEFVEIAYKLRPDIALIAVMDDGSGPVVEIDAARSMLAEKDIKLEILAGAQAQLHHDPHLPGPG